MLWMVTRPLPLVLLSLCRFSEVLSERKISLRSLNRLRSELWLLLQKLVAQIQLVIAVNGNFAVQYILRDFLRFF